MTPWERDSTLHEGPPPEVNLHKATKLTVKYCFFIYYRYRYITLNKNSIFPDFHHHHVLNLSRRDSDCVFFFFGLISGKLTEKPLGAEPLSALTLLTQIHWSLIILIIISRAVIKAGMDTTEVKKNGEGKKGREPQRNRGVHQRRTEETAERASLTNSASFLATSDPWFN